MEQHVLKRRVESLFDDSSVPKKFENHMPVEVSSFLLEVSKGNINSNILEEDKDFAKSLSQAISIERI